MSFISYAQNLEDVMLYRALKHIERGFYIDVGAQHPVIESITKAFYDRGWRGINVEPVNKYFQLLQKDRIRDINLNMLVGASEGEREFYEFPETGLSTLSKAYAERNSAAGFAESIYTVGCTTLDSICRRQNVSIVHFLKIDVEGAEKEVLQGFSFEKVRPWIVVIEANEPNSTLDISNQWESLIMNKNYECVYYDGLNRFYLAREHSDLKVHFRVPPNFFDQYITYPEYLAQHDLADERHQKAVLAKQLADETAQLQQELADERHRKEILAKQLADETAHLQQELADERHQKAVLAKQLADETAQLQHDLADERHQKVVLAKQLADETALLKHDLADERHQKALLVKQLADETAHLQMVRRSLSWRLTAPLRTIKNGITRFILKVLNKNKNLIKAVLRFLFRFKWLVRMGGWILKDQPGIRAKIAGVVNTQSRGNIEQSENKSEISEISEIIESLPESARSIYQALKDAYNKNHKTEKY